MFFHLHHTSAYRTEQENRLCYNQPSRSPDRASETLRMPDQIKMNKDISAVREAFDTEELRAEFEFMNGSHPQDRLYFQSLMLDSSLPDGKGYTDIQRNDINVSDPFGLEAKTDEERGQWLIENLPAEFLSTIDGDHKNSPHPARLGALYLSHIKRAQQEWKDNGVVADSPVLHLPLERYASLKESLSEIFQKYGVRIPGSETDSVTVETGNMSRREYFILLATLWNNHTTLSKVEESLKKTEGNPPQERLQALREIGEASASKVQAAESVYVDLSLEELGPEETLTGMGIRLSPDLKSAYLNLIQGRSANFGDRVLSVDGEPESVGLPIKPSEGAGTWEAYPERSVAFLTQYMASGGKENQDFLTSLRFYFGPDQNKPDAAPLSEEDTRAILRFVSQHLLEAEQVVYQSQNQLNTFRTQQFGAEKVEKTVGNMWEYMKDIRSHPLGSGLMWVAAFVAARQVWKFMKGEHKNYMKVLYGAAIFGTGLTLYQQHQYGKTTAGEIWNKMKGMIDGDKAKPPEEQTLSTYWSKELDITPLREQVALSFIGEQPIGQTLDWYEQMREWKMRGSNPAEQIPAPFRMDAKLQRYFGKLPRKESENIMYSVLEKFLSNRGAAVRSTLPQYAQSMSIEQDDMLGLAYMRHRYMEEMFFESYVYGIVRVADIRDDIDPDSIRNFNPDDPYWKEFAAKKPELYASIIRVREEYRKELRQRDTADWNMSMVFMQEANPEIMRRMGRDGTEVGMYMRFLKSDFVEDAQDVLDSVIIQTGKYAQSTVLFLDRNGKVAIQWLDAKGKEIYNDTVDSIEVAKIWLDRQLRMAEGVSENVVDAFIRKRKEIQNIDGRLYVQPINGGVNVQVGFVRTGALNIMYQGVPTKNFNLFAPVTMSLGEYLDANSTPRVLVDKWIQGAVSAKKTELSTPPSGFPGLAIEARLAGNDQIEFAQTFGSTEPVGRSSLYDFMDASTEKIYDRYSRWKNLVQNNQTTIQDPLAL